MRHCFFFNDTATTEIYTLSLHDALPIFDGCGAQLDRGAARGVPHCHLGRRGTGAGAVGVPRREAVVRSEEHTSELQSRQYLVCRLLLEKKINIPLLPFFPPSTVPTYSRF